jgi:hypothetical protein
VNIHDISLDWKLAFFTRVARSLDYKLRELDREAKRVPDPDAWGVLDCYEEIYGIGFVIAQNYVGAVCGSLRRKKDSVMECGTPLSNGLTIAQAVNHGANYWKHREEWADGNALGMMERTKKNIAKFGCQPGRDYVLSCVMAALVPPPHRMAPLMRRLDQWRREVRKNA